MMGGHPVNTLRKTALLALAALCLWPMASTAALDKQSSAHGGQLGGSDSGFALSGNLLFGVAAYNPSYAARPDNTGRALLRAAAHFDIDLIGSRLSIPVDMNMFTDRERRALGELVPTELDVITGLTSTWPVDRMALELGARFESDMPVDRGGYSQTYVDVRSRLLFALSEYAPGIHSALAGGDVSGALTLGVFAINPTYAARPDNTGIALFRYALHLTMHVTTRFYVGLDATFFTDRERMILRPTECDFTPELGMMIIPGLEVHLAYERDMPLDKGGLVQQLLLIHLSWDFTLVAAAEDEVSRLPNLRKRVRF
jgi:hypothetical protein